MLGSSWLYLSSDAAQDYGPCSCIGTARSPASTHGATALPERPALLCRHFAPALVLSLLDPKLSWDEAEVQASIQQGVEVVKADGTPLSPYDLKRLQVCCPASVLCRLCSPKKELSEKQMDKCVPVVVQCHVGDCHCEGIMQSTCQPKPRAGCGWAVTHNKTDA